LDGIFLYVDGRQGFHTAFPSPAGRGVRGEAGGMNGLTPSCPPLPREMGMIAARFNF